uniref:FAD-binding PCMH-type domain-containing protein n=1 Tax=Globisporangium ultimum (strain ATCC 200006 / CBS 805.95 / DAOM BR144) TaxID=431595 RepID=K3WQ61_GLOUD
MARATPSEWANTVAFTLNNAKVEITNPHPQWKLIDYLRDTAHLTGTKLSCGEGGCGACTVVLCHRPLDRIVSDETADEDDVGVHALWKDGDVVYRAVNACLFPVCALDGIAVLTVEGIGSTTSELHAIQSRLAQSNGTQCGFCTPGWVMNMYELVRTHDHGKGRGSKKTLTKQVVEDHFDGNLCRCTGYRPIFEAFHSFAVDKDVAPDDLVTKKEPLRLGYDDEEAVVCANDAKEASPPSCQKDASSHLDYLQHACDHFEDWLLIDADSMESGRKSICEGRCATKSTCSKYLDLEDLIPDRITNFEAHAPYDAGSEIQPSEFIINFEARPLKFQAGNLKWYRPLTLEQLFDAVQDAESNVTDLMFIGGRTSYGVSKYYNDTAPYNRPESRAVQIEMNYIPALKTIKVNDDQGFASIGAAVTISTLLRFLQTYNDGSNASIQQLSMMVGRVANNQVRNSGTWAGNLSLCRDHPTFVSDLVVGLMGIGATLTLLDDKQNEKKDVNIDEFLLKPSTEFALILSMNLPLYTSVTTDNAHHEIRFQCFKVAQRPQNAHSHVNCAIWMRVHQQNIDNEQSSKICSEARVVFGGVCKHPARFPLTEACLKGSNLTTTTLAAAMQQLEKDLARIGASDAFGSQEFRASVMKNVLYKAFVACVSPDLEDPTVASAASALTRKVSSGVQSFKPRDDTAPVSKAIPKLGATMQVSGEAQYVSDKELNASALYGSILYSTVALRKVLVIDEGGKARALPGVVDIVTAADIPGANDISSGVDDKEPLFVPVGGIVRCIGAPLAVIIATSAEVAEQAVALCAVTYGDVPARDRWHNQHEPIVNIDMAMEAGTLGQEQPIAMGDSDVVTKLNASPHRLTGTLHLGAQKHFYMEPQVSVASLQEGNVVLVETSSQHPLFVQQQVASVLGVAFNAVDVKVQRVGGGFGGKLTRCAVNAGAAALAATKHRRTVRVLNDRSADFRLVGGRENMKGTYTVGFDKDGYIHALDVTLYVDCGYTIGDSVGDVQMAVQWSDSAYRVPSFRCRAFLYLTNTQTCTSHRAPGVPQSLVLVETALNHIATYLDLPMTWVQERNLYKEGDRTPYGQQLTEVRLQEVWDRLLVSSHFAQRDEKNALFNSNNKWKKRAIAATPTKYGMQYSGRRDGAKIDIFAGDGSVLITHGGCEIGQV